MLRYIVILIIIVCRFSRVDSYKENIDELNSNFTSLAKAYGYEADEYQLTTKDGYILNLFRINNKTAIQDNNSYPVVMLHGVGGCANNWILSARRSLPFLLADLGYDIWMINSRGTIYSTKHLKYTIKDKEYWAFSWHEIAVYDTPASIDFVLNKTDHNKVFIIGHSEGATVFFAMASDLPEYDKKVEMSINLAPSVFLRDIKVDLVYALSRYYLLIDKILVDQLQLFTYIPNFETTSKVLMELCRTFLSEACKEIAKTLFEDDPQVNTSMVPFIFSKVPCGGSVRETLHYLQNVHTGGFNHYSYGPKENLKKYGSTEAPPYNLRGIKSKVAIIYGGGDRFSTKKDCERLVRILPNVVFFKTPENPYWTHMDFLLAKDVYNVSYKDVLYLVKRYNKLNSIK